MIRVHSIVSAASLALALVPPVVFATSTDGFHGGQIVPIAVETSSFTTSFFFHNPSNTATDVQVNYYPGVGTSTAAVVNCGVKTLPAFNVVAFSTLTALCPGVTAGTNFGWVNTATTNPENKRYAVFTRVDNPQAQGFEIESFPPHTFTSATSHVIGLTRSAAGPGRSTNCFIGAMSEPATVQVSLHSATNTQIGSTQSYSLAAHEFRRLFDIFAVVGAPAGDYANARLQVVENGSGEPAVIAFCTVQNNTTFDADFRIAKAFPAQDDHAIRTLSRTGDANGIFTLGIFPNERNRHIVWLKHPDWIQCSVAATGGGTTADLEMRLLAADGTTVIAGGDAAVGFGKVYLGGGGKGTLGNGRNTSYYLDVESTGASSVNYSFNCESGSGAVGGEVVQRNLQDQF